MDNCTIKKLSRLSIDNRPSGPDHRTLDALLDYSEKTSALLYHAVSRRLLETIPLRTEQAVESMLKVTDWGHLQESNNFLKARPHLWARFSEPQITSGFAYFLNEENTLGRCQAAFDAAWTDTNRPAPVLQSVELVGAELGKIDLLVIGICEDKTRVALCVEAKLGHRLTEGQLDKYKTQVTNHHKIKLPEAACLLILAPTHCPDIAKALQKGDWNFMEWKQWLIGYDNALPRFSDSTDFQRFRKTIHERNLEEIN